MKHKKASLIIFFTLLLLPFLLPFIITGVSLAASVFDCHGDACGTKGGLSALFSKLPGMGLIESDDMIAVILGWVKLALILLGTLAFVAFVWAGALYILAFTNEENAESAKKILLWTTIGIIVILFSYVVTSALINMRVS